MLANKYWVVEISMSSEQHVGTYKHYNIMNTNYTKIHARFFNDFIWCNQFGKRGYAYAMKYAVAISYTEHSQQVRELKSL